MLSKPGSTVPLLQGPQKLSGCQPLAAASCQLQQHQEHNEPSWDSTRACMLYCRADRCTSFMQVFSVTGGPVIKPATCLHSSQHRGHLIVALGSALQSRRGSWADDLGCELISCDEQGTICVWEAQRADRYNCVQTIQGGMPCSGLAVRKGFVIAGRTDGAVRIYGLVSRALVASCRIDKMRASCVADELSWQANKVVMGCCCWLLVLLAASAAHV